MATRTFTYWVAPSTTDHPCYSLIGRTRAEVVKQFEVHGDAVFDAPEKRVIQYRDLFDFFEQVTGEGGGRLWGSTVKKEKS